MTGLLDDKVARNMLYIEALAAVSRGHLELPPGDKDSLTTLKSKGLKKEVGYTSNSSPVMYCYSISRLWLDCLSVDIDSWMASASITR